MIRSRLAILTMALAVATTSQGGGFDFLPDPSSTQQNILYFGIGPSLNSALLENTVNSSQALGATPTVALYTAVLKYNHNVISYAPSAEAGYWYLTNSDWALGAKILYKYLGIKTDANTLPQSEHTTTILGDSSVNSTTTFSHNVDNEGLFLVAFGKKIRNWLFYLDAGLALFTNSVNITDQASIESTQRIFTDIGTRIITHHVVQTFDSQNDTLLLGGAAQLGVNYSLPQDWALDIAYTFAVSAAKTLPNVTFHDLDNIDNFQVISKIFAQEIVLSVNKNFIL